MGNCQNQQQSDKSFEKNSKTKSSTVTVKASTWFRDSQGLFDYEAADVNFQPQMKIKNGGIFVRKGNGIVVKSENDVIAPDEFEVLRINQRDGDQWVSSAVFSAPLTEPQAPTTESNDKNAWIVVKSLINTPAFAKGYKLKDNDIVKLGRVRFRVREISIESKKKPNLQFDDNKANMIADIINNPNPEVNNPVCRICLANESDGENPLVNPCLCAGTMKYVHIKCLQQWLKSRIHTRDTEVAFTIAWKNLNCELCKKTYPNSIQSEGTTFYPLELPTSNTDSYIILEVLGKENNQARGLHFINLKAKPLIKLGRGHESDVRISDISVSRCHAKLTLENGNVYLTDNDSKFGTLVQLKKTFPLISGLNNISLQIGRTSLSFSVGGSSPKSSLTAANLKQSQTLSADNTPAKCPAVGDFDFNNGCSHFKLEQNSDDEIPAQMNGGQNNNNDEEVQNIEDLLYQNSPGNANNNNLVAHY